MTTLYIAELKLIQTLQKFKMRFANPSEVYELSTIEPMVLLGKPYESVMDMPRHLSELKPIDVMNLEGSLIGVRFINPSGDNTNVMAESNISPNARIFQGTQPYFRPVMEAARADAHPDCVCVIPLPVLTKSFMCRLPEGCRKVSMQLKIIGKLLYDVSRYTPTDPSDARSRLSQYERAIILVSDDTQRFSPGDPQWDSDKVQGATAKVILEEVPLNGPLAEPSELVRMKLD